MALPGLILLLLCNLSYAGSANLDGPAPTSQSILGRWRYSGFEYEGNRYNPSPNLELFFDFRADGVARLGWSRVGERGFCERQARYLIKDGDILYQQVLWLNPGNDARCGQDPDMQMGRETENRVEVTGGELRIFMQLNGQDFIYVLSKQHRDATPKNEEGNGLFKMLLLDRD
jgi:hypothetical protein